MIVATHRLLGAPLAWVWVWVWDNLNIHLQAELKEFAEVHDDWLRIFHLPSYAPDLNPRRKHLKRSIANFLAPTLGHLVGIIKRRLKELQYRPNIITGCLVTTGLTIKPKTSN